MTASVCYVEKRFSKGVYIMQSLFGAVTMLLLSLSLGMGWRAFVLVGVCILTALAGVSKKTLPIPFFAALLSAVIFHKKFLTSLAGLLNCVLTAHGKSAGVVEMILIIVVLIGLVLIFKKQLTTLVNNIFQTISREAGKV